MIQSCKGRIFVEDKTLCVHGELSESRETLYIYGCELPGQICFSKPRIEPEQRRLLVGEYWGGLSQSTLAAEATKWLAC